MKKPAMHFHIVTLFPEALRGYFSASIIGRAVKDGLIAVSYYNPRDYTKDRWCRIDRRPYGGGPGMVIEALPVVKAAEAARREAGRAKAKTIFFSAGGTPFTNIAARGYARGAKHLILICGHYEGVDERARKILKADAFSIGPYVLTGGEAPALVVADAVARHVPGVLGKAESLEEFRAASHEVYTRPEILRYKGTSYRVPKVLLSGHHAEIEAWKRKKGGVKRA